MFAVLSEVVEQRGRQTEVLVALHVRSFARPFDAVPELELVGALRTGSSPRRALPSHRHRTTEITYLVEGTVCWWVAGRWWHLTPGTFFVAPPDMPHRGMPNSLSSCGIYWAQCDLAAEGAPFGLAPEERDHLVRQLVQSPAACQAVRDPVPLFERVLRTVQAGPDPLGALRVRSAVAELLLCISDSFAAAAEVPVVELQPVERARSLMLSTLRQPVPLGSVARSVGWSTSTLHLRFRQQVGSSPGDYYLRQRVLAAAFDLAASPASISEIAHDFGFSSSQYFATAFRRVLGVSPTAYRRAWSDAAPDAPYAVEMEGDLRF